MCRRTPVHVRVGTLYNYINPFTPVSHERSICVLVCVFICILHVYITLNYKGLRTSVLADGSQLESISRSWHSGSLTERGPRPTTRTLFLFCGVTRKLGFYLRSVYCEASHHRSVRGTSIPEFRSVVHQYSGHWDTFNRRGGPLTLGVASVPRRHTTYSFAYRVTNRSTSKEFYSKSRVPRFQENLRSTCLTEVWILTPWTNSFKVHKKEWW